jgi:hypothetical protein
MQKRRTNVWADRKNDERRQAEKRADKADKKFEVLAKAIKNKGIE